jgi:hypothetical protein
MLIRKNSIAAIEVSARDRLRHLDKQYSTVDSVLTHTCQWTPKSMGYYRVWDLAELVPAWEPSRWT